MINIIINTVSRNDIPSHIGDKTHSQDQLITFVNLSVINTMVSRPAKPIPPDDDVLLLMFYVC